MKAAILIRSGSISPRTEVAGRLPAGVNEDSSNFRRRSRSLRTCLDAKQKDLMSPMETQNPLRRVRSDTDLIRLTPLSSRSSPTVRLSEELTYPLMSQAPAVTEEAVELDYAGGGMGNGKKIGRGSGSRGESDANRDQDSRIGNYYKDMLKTDPSNPLVLRNYARFLHEVEGDLERAEEYYGRAILESPGDGELLSLYGRLVWESQRDCRRAEGYFERAMTTAPDDCYIMGSYAHFLWDAEEGENVDEDKVASSSPVFVSS